MLPAAGNGIQLDCTVTRKPHQLSSVLSRKTRRLAAIHDIKLSNFTGKRSFF